MDEPNLTEFEAANDEPELSEVEEALALAVAQHRQWLEGLDSALVEVIKIIVANAQQPAFMADELQKLLPPEPEADEPQASDEE